MGIPKAGAALLYELKKDYQLGESVLQLGKQALYVEADQLPIIAAQFGVLLLPAGIFIRFTNDPPELEN